MIYLVEMDSTYLRRLFNLRLYRARCQVMLGVLNLRCYCHTAQKTA
jgi:hypothetical protein